MELWHSFQRMKDINLIIHFILVSLFTFIKYGLLGYKMALNTTFGDGTPITFAEMNEIRHAIHKNMVYSRWQKGDILCIDNFSTSHGRQPTYDKGRSVIVAWSHPLDKTTGKSLSSTSEAINNVTKPTAMPSAISKIDEVDSDADEDTPEMVESPDNSPSTTLTKEEAQELKDLFLNDRFEDQMAMAFSKLEESRNKNLHKRQASCPSLLFVPGP